MKTTQSVPKALTADRPRRRKPDCRELLNDFIAMQTLGVLSLLCLLIGSFAGPMFMHLALRTSWTSRLSKKPGWRDFMQRDESFYQREHYFGLLKNDSEFTPAGVVLRRLAYASYLLAAISLMILIVTAILREA